MPIHHSLKTVLWQNPIDKTSLIKIILSGRRSWAKPLGGDKVGLLEEMEIAQDNGQAYKIDIFEVLALKGQLHQVLPKIAHHISAILAREKIDISTMYNSIARGIALYKSTKALANEASYLENISTLDRCFSEAILPLLYVPTAAVTECQQLLIERNASHAYALTSRILYILDTSEDTPEKIKIVRDITTAYLTSKLPDNATIESYITRSALSASNAQKFDEVIAPPIDVLHSVEANSITSVNQVVAASNEAQHTSSRVLAPVPVNTASTKTPECALADLAQKLLSKKFLSILDKNAKAFLGDAPGTLPLLIFALSKLEIKNLQKQYDAILTNQQQSSINVAELIKKSVMQADSDKSYRAFLDSDDRTLYDVAAACDNLAIAECLFKQGIQNGVYNQHSTKSLLHTAAKYHAKNVLRYLLCDQKELSIDWYDALSEAFKYVDPTVVDLYITDTLVNKDIRDSSGQSSNKLKYTILNKVLLEIQQLCKIASGEINGTKQTALEKIPAVCSLLMSLIDKEKLFYSTDTIVISKTLELAASIHRREIKLSSKTKTETEEIAIKSLSNLIQRLKTEFSKLNLPDGCEKYLTDLGLQEFDKASSAGSVVTHASLDTMALLADDASSSDYE